MAYIALYRKWRPKSFSSLVGQEHVSRTLARAIESGRIGHAYLFAGPRGTGKTSTAKILAKALNCEKGPTPEPCGECESCRRIDDGSSMDVFEIDAASNRGIDEIRELRETVKFAPVDGRSKVYIIDEVHMLTSEAFNALLKTLEEPPASVVFILATTEAHKVPATIQSRCQRYDFKRISENEIVGRLRYIADESGIRAEDSALSLIAREAEGGMRDALSTLDQCASLAEDGVTGQLVRDILGLVGREQISRILRAVAARDAKDAIEAVSEILREGKEPRRLVTELIEELRSAMVFQAAGELFGTVLSDAERAALSEEAKLFAPEDFPIMLRRLSEAAAELRWASEPRIAVESALLALCRPESSGASTAPSSADAARIASLEARVARLAAQLAAKNPPESPAPAKIRTEPTPSGQTGPKPSMQTEPVLSPLPPDKPAPLNQSPVNSADEANSVSNASKNETPEEKPQSDTARSAPASKNLPLLSADPEITEEGAALWQRVLASLEADQSRKVIHACLSKGVFGGTTEDEFIVRFSSPFLKMRLEREDYRALIEDFIEELSGRRLYLAVEVEKKRSSRAASPRAPKKKKLMVDMAELSPEERPVLQAAIDIFGDNIVPPEDAPAKKTAKKRTPPPPSEKIEVVPPPGDESDIPMSEPPPPDDESFAALLEDD